MRKKSYLKKKQYLDIYLCLMALVFLSPFFLALMIAIKLDSPGPVFFKQKRIGIHKKHFLLSSSELCVQIRQKICRPIF